MSIADPVVTPLAEALLECLRTEVAKVANPPEQVCLRTGDVVSLLISLNEDECCSGLAWVRPVTFFAGIDFVPQEIPLISGQITSWFVGLEMGVARCAPTTGATRNPTCEQWTAVTRAVNDDAAAMRRALCCFNATRAGRVAPGAWEPMTVEGGCTGGVMQITVRSGPCDC